ncbi:MAG TPA: helix-turn-helix domain-containing protein [Sandaracinaceae bacterium LLY-WYZ-13_1]|nr:helix-turn-helix domain-containing protein [Sandaracinaceae bacterium LLY-WYZ-13_1]
MKTYGQFCPVAMALEVVGDRWSLLVVRELLAGSARFSEMMRGMPRIPRSMLSRRLTQLEERGMIRRTEDAGGRVTYALTDAGRALRGPVDALGRWGRQWVQAGMTDEHLDASLVLWDMQRRIDFDAVPDERVVVRFELSGGERYWLKLEPGEADVCTTHPGFEETLVLRSDTRALTEVWAGLRDFSEAIAQRRIRIDGPRRHARALPDWLRLNAYARDPG